MCVCLSGCIYVYVCFGATEKAHLSRDELERHHHWTVCLCTSECHRTVIVVQYLVHGSILDFKTLILKVKVGLDVLYGTGISIRLAMLVSKTNVWVTSCL